VTAILSHGRLDRLSRLLASALPAALPRRRLPGLLLALVGAPRLLPEPPAGGGAPRCDPDCLDRDCGPDGCGGSCGECRGGAVCLEEVGLCAVDPGPCRLAGEACAVGSRCCDPLACVGGICRLPVCVPVGSVCGPGIACCAGSDCAGGICVAAAPTCAPTGLDCAAVPCCAATDTCAPAGGGHVCILDPAPEPACTKAGRKPGRAGSCCPRLHLEGRRCVIDRWERCTAKKGRKAWCETGTSCRAEASAPAADAAAPPASPAARAAEPAATPVTTACLPLP